VVKVKGVSQQQSAKLKKERTWGAVRKGGRAGIHLRDKGSGKKTWGAQCKGGKRRNERPVSIREGERRGKTEEGRCTGRMVAIMTRKWRP